MSRGIPARFPEVIGDGDYETAEHERHEDSHRCPRRDSRDEPSRSGRGSGAVVLMGQCMALAALQQVS